MKVKYYETIFEVTETLQNGKERRIKKSVYIEKHDIIKLQITAPDKP